MRELLKDAVIALVKHFVAMEGGISLRDLEILFGLALQGEVAAALARLPISFSQKD